MGRRSGFRPAKPNTALDGGHNGLCDSNAGRRPRPVNVGPLCSTGRTVLASTSFGRRSSRCCRRGGYRCACMGLPMWSPTRATIDPFPDPAGIADTIDPDGGVGLHGREIGFGWEYTSLRGERFTTNGKEDVIWAGPYGGVYHRFVGWPLSGLRSRVEVLDSEAANRFSEGQPEPQVVLQQRRRWESPAREILYRGIATTDLPGWTRARFRTTTRACPDAAGLRDRHIDLRRRLRTARQHKSYRVAALAARTARICRDHGRCCITQHCTGAARRQPSLASSVWSCRAGQ